MKFLVLIFVYLNFVNSLTLDCEFKTDRFYGYSCLIKSLEISSKFDRTIDKVTGNHQNRKNNTDVKFFESRGKILNYLPKNLDKFFKNIEAMYIWSSNLKEITNSDLKPFLNLKFLYLWDNDIQILKSDLFKNNPKIKLLYLSKNKIKKVEKGIFDNLLQLEELDFENNDCYLKYAFTGGVDKEAIENNQTVKYLYTSGSLAKAIEDTCG